MHEGIIIWRGIPPTRQRLPDRHPCWARSSVVVLQRAPHISQTSREHRCRKSVSALLEVSDVVVRVVTASVHCPNLLAHHLRIRRVAPPLGGRRHGRNRRKGGGRTSGHHTSQNPWRLALLHIRHLDVLHLEQGLPEQGRSDLLSDGGHLAGIQASGGEIGDVRGHQVLAFQDLSRRPNVVEVPLDPSFRTEGREDESWLLHAAARNCIAP
mmetsp:Transcript_93841/g.268968  ORF Transcript_93841/g.268968 Transcript_93841/m.268968 type:complete len:211 (+) Transcript_93841:35-667(+)